MLSRSLLLHQHSFRFYQNHRVPARCLLRAPRTYTQRTHGVLSLSPKSSVSMICQEEVIAPIQALQRDSHGLETCIKISAKIQNVFPGPWAKMRMCRVSWLKIKKSNVSVTTIVLHLKDISRSASCIDPIMFTKPWFLVLRHVYPLHSACRKFAQNYGTSS